jgi:hypothetical protein
MKTRRLLRFERVGDLFARKSRIAPRSAVRLGRIGAAFLIAGTVLVACELQYHLTFNTYVPGKTASQLTGDPAVVHIESQGFMPTSNGPVPGTYVEVWPEEEDLNSGGDADLRQRALDQLQRDPAAALSGTPPYLPFLLRQPDCSLTRVIIDSNLAVQEEDLGYQNFLHAAQGVSTVPDRFTKGCIDPTTGIASEVAARVGTFANGNSALAIESTDGVLVAVVSSTLAVLSEKDYPTISTSVSGAEVWGLATADINGDGIPDMVVASATSATTGTLSIFLGQGNGSFTAGETLNVPLNSSMGTPRLGVTIDDVNGDGKLDLIATTAASSSSSGITVFLGQGNGSFGAGITGPVNVGGQVAVTADFNGDGKKDIATSYGQILLGNGDGTFNLVSQSLPEGQQAGLAAADYNQDGKVDLAFASALGLDVYFGNGDGTFTYSASYVGLPGQGSVQASDLDGDGFPDLFVGTAHGGFYSFDIDTESYFQMVLNQGNGTFGLSRVYYQQGPNAALANTPDAGVQYDVADFNGDSKPDVVMLATNGATPVLSVLAGNGDGTLRGSGATGIQTSLSNPASAQYVTAVVAGDVNGDGKTDVVFAWTPNGTDQLNPNAHISVALGNGNGTFQAQQDYAIPSPVGESLNDSGAPTLVVTDINGDGKPDITYIDEHAALYVMLNNGNGTFATPQQVGTEPNLTSLAVQDVNGDGKPDIVAITGSNVPPSTPLAAYVYLGNGNGTFQTPTTLAPGAYWLNAVAIADMNGDGKPDIVIAGQSSDKSTAYVNVLLGNGNGTFQAAIVNSFSLEFSSAIAIGDIDGDGRLDVVMAGTVGSVFFGNGDGTFDSTYSGSVYSLQNATRPKVAKLSSSGASNVLVADSLGLSVQVFTGNTPHTPTTTTLAASTPILTPAQSVTLKVTISPQSGSGTPTGYVSVLDTTSNVSLGYGTLSGGSLTVATTALTASGAHTIEAFYSGDASYAPSTSAASTVTVTGTAGAGFTLSASSPFSVIDAAGSPPTTTLTVTPTGGFAGKVSLSCSGLPTGASCNFSPATVTLSSAAATSVLTVTTVSSGKSQVRGSLLAAGLLLAGVLLPVLLRRSRAPLMSKVLSVALLCFGLLLGGCGGSSGPGASTSTSASSSSGSSTSSSSSGSSTSSSSSSSGSSASSSSGSSSSGGSLTGVTAGAYTINITASSGTYSQTLSYGVTVN